MLSCLALPLQQYVTCSGGTSRRRHLTHFMIKPTVEAIMVSGNQLDQYFQLSRTCYGKTLLVNHSPILDTIYVNHNYSGLDKVMQLCTCIQLTLLVCTNVSEISKMSLATCSLLLQRRSHNKRLAIMSDMIHLSKPYSETPMCTRIRNDTSQREYCLEI